MKDLFLGTCHIECVTFQREAEIMAKSKIFRSPS